MEGVISDHLTSWDVFPAIYPLIYKVNVLAKNSFKCLPHSFDGGKWVYEKNTKHDVESIFLKKTNIIEMNNALNIKIFINNRSISWSGKGKLLNEIYYHHNSIIAERKIKYVNESKIITIIGFHFLYDLKSYLSDNDYSYPNIGRYSKEELEEIAKGNLNLMNLNRYVFFYVDEGNKVNAITSEPFLNPVSISLFKYIEVNNTSKLIIEMEKLRVNFRTYRPDFNFLFLKDSL